MSIKKQDNKGTEQGRKAWRMEKASMAEERTVGDIQPVIAHDIRIGNDRADHAQDQEFNVSIFDLQTK